MTKKWGRVTGIGAGGGVNNNLVKITRDTLASIAREKEFKINSMQAVTQVAIVVHRIVFVVSRLNARGPESESSVYNRTEFCFPWMCIIRAPCTFEGTTHMVRRVRQQRWTNKKNPNPTRERPESSGEHAPFSIPFQSSCKIVIITVIIITEHIPAVNNV